MMLNYLQSFYETAGIPFQFAQAPNGQQVPILDRRAFLHCAVFEAKAAPEEAFKVRFNCCKEFQSVQQQQHC